MTRVSMILHLSIIFLIRQILLGCYFKCNSFLSRCLCRTPLMAAVGNGFVDCANLLLGEGANLLALDVNQRSALHRVVSSRRDVA